MPIEFRKLEIGEDHVDAILAGVLQRPAWRVEQLQIQLRIDLADDFRKQQAAAEQVIDDKDGIALGSREGDLRDHTGGRGGPRRQGGHWLSFRGIRRAKCGSRHSDKAIVMPRAEPALSRLGFV
jgi:hypothetical protein